MDELDMSCSGNARTCRRDARKAKPIPLSVTAFPWLDEDAGKGKKERWPKRKLEPPLSGFVVVAERCPQRLPMKPEAEGENAPSAVRSMYGIEHTVAIFAGA